MAGAPYLHRLSVANQRAEHVSLSEPWHLQQAASEKGCVGTLMAGGTAWHLGQLSVLSEDVRSSYIETPIINCEHARLCCCGTGADLRRVTRDSALNTSKHCIRLLNGDLNTRGRSTLLKT